MSISSSVKKGIAKAKEGICKAKEVIGVAAGFLLVLRLLFMLDGQMARPFEPPVEVTNPAPTPLESRRPPASDAQKAKALCEGPANPEWLPRGGDGNQPNDPRLHPVAIEMGLDGSLCVRGQEGGARCWGRSKCKFTPNLGGLKGGGGAKAGSQAFASGARFKRLSLGIRHACGVTHGGKVWCWGSNGWDQLGYGNEAIKRIECSQAAASESWKLPGKAVDVTASGNCSCALLENGDAYCAGDSSVIFALGEKSSERPRAARKLRFPYRVKQIQFSKSHGCALDRRGKVHCWGQNTRGELGTGKAGTQIPLTAKTLLATAAAKLPAKASQLALGGRHTCALVKGGRVYCWGDNARGQVGRSFTKGENGDTIRLKLSATPLKVRLGGLATSVHASRTHSCAILKNGGLRCWGSNSTYELGRKVSPPEGMDRVAGILSAPPSEENPVVDAALGFGTTCSLRKDGSIRCWGNNRFYSRGDCMSEPTSFAESKPLRTAPANSR